jgi:hypothetical protein
MNSPPTMRRSNDGDSLEAFPETPASQRRMKMECDGFRDARWAFLIRGKRRERKMA